MFKNIFRAHNMQLMYRMINSNLFFKNWKNMLPEMLLQTSRTTKIITCTEKLFLTYPRK